MMISVMAPPTGGQSYSTEALAMVQHAFTVPPIPGGQSDDALDLGTIPMKAIKNLKPGEIVTEIAGADMDGKPTKLSDLRGKVVLVHFYAADHSPALVPEFASLKKVWDGLGKDPRFTMLSCSLDAKPDAPKRFLAKHPATWPQVYVGDWQKTEVPREWNVNRFPSLYLVAPDGKLLARDLTFDGLEAKIRAALDGK
jgi:peroxiredoxin